MMRARRGGYIYIYRRLSVGRGRGGDPNIVHWKHALSRPIILHIATLWEGKKSVITDQATPISCQNTTPPPPP